MKIRKRVSPEVDPATAIISDFLREVSFSSIPRDVVVHATDMVTDTIGVSLGAVGSEPVEIARSLVDQAPPSVRENTTATVLGYGDRTRPREAAFLNGMLANALDFDDLHQRMGGHPSSPVLPAVLSLGEANGISGETFLTAFISGVEVETTLGEILNPGHYERGWHPTAVLGHMGATAAAGVLLGLDADGFRSAFGIAASQAGGSKANLGSMTKPYHVGNAARMGIEAAQLAAAGFSARETIIEDEFGGFCELFKGAAGYAFDDHLDRLGDPWGLRSPPVGFKPYPCCASAHSAIDCAIHLNDTYSFDPSTIKDVTITAHPRRLQHTDDPDPTTGLEGKISIQYVVARGLLDGDVWISDFTNEAVRDRDVRDVMSNTHLARSPEVPEDEQWGAHLKVHTTTGETVSRAVQNPKGSAANPMTRGELEEKYVRCAEHVLPSGATDRSLGLLAEIDTVSDISVLFDDLTRA